MMRLTKFCCLKVHFVHMFPSYIYMHFERRQWLTWDRCRICWYETSNNKNKHAWKSLHEQISKCIYTQKAASSGWILKIIVIQQINSEICALLQSWVYLSSRVNIIVPEWHNVSSLYHFLCQQTKTFLDHLSQAHSHKVCWINVTP